MENEKFRQKAVENSVGGGYPLPYPPLCGVPYGTPKELPSLPPPPPPPYQKAGYATGNHYTFQVIDLMLI